MDMDGLKTWNSMEDVLDLGSMKRISWFGHRTSMELYLEDGSWTHFWRMDGDWFPLVNGILIRWRRSECWLVGSFGGFSLKPPKFSHYNKITFPSQNLSCVFSSLSSPELLYSSFGRPSPSHNSRNRSPSGPKAWQCKYDNFWFWTGVPGFYFTTLYNGVPEKNVFWRNNDGFHRRFGRVGNSSDQTPGGS